MIALSQDHMGQVFTIRYAESCKNGVVKHDKSYKPIFKHEARPIDALISNYSL